MTWALDSWNANGTAGGHLVVFFGPGDTQQGSSEDLTVSPDGQSLHFEFSTTWVA